MKSLIAAANAAKRAEDAAIRVQNTLTRALEREALEIEKLRMELNRRDAALRVALVRAGMDESAADHERMHLLAAAENILRDRQRIQQRAN